MNCKIAVCSQEQLTYCRPPRLRVHKSETLGRKFLGELGGMRLAAVEGSQLKETVT